MSHHYLLQQCLQKHHTHVRISSEPGQLQARLTPCISSPSQCLNHPGLSDASCLMNEIPLKPFAFRSHMEQNPGFDLNLHFATSENSSLAQGNPAWQQFSSLLFLIVFQQNS